MGFPTKQQVERGSPVQTLGSPIHGELVQSTRHLGWLVGGGSGARGGPSCAVAMQGRFFYIVVEKAIYSPPLLKTLCASKGIPKKHNYKIISRPSNKNLHRNKTWHWNMSILRTPFKRSHHRLSQPPRTPRRPGGHPAGAPGSLRAPGRLDEETVLEQVHLFVCFGCFGLVVLFGCFGLFALVALVCLFCLVALVCLLWLLWFGCFVWLLWFVCFGCFGLVVLFGCFGLFALVALVWLFCFVLFGLDVCLT